mgnify:CR=1 FL=1
MRHCVARVGADRLLASRYGVLEAIGILYTVDNRMDRSAVNPLDLPRAPDYPGCGPGGSFATSA